MRYGMLTQKTILTFKTKNELERYVNGEDIGFTEISKPENINGSIIWDIVVDGIETDIEIVDC